MNREFNAERPNQKWETDISYIKSAQGFLYLSIIRDLYDNSIIAYKTDKEQSIKLVLDTIKAAKRKEKITAEVQLHSGQGFQYTSQAYFNLTQSYGITPSMSRRGNPYDNALASSVGKNASFPLTVTIESLSSRIYFLPTLFLCQYR